MSDVSVEHEDGSGVVEAPTNVRHGRLFTRQTVKRKDRKQQPRYLTVTGGIVSLSLESLSLTLYEQLLRQ